MFYQFQIPSVLATAIRDEDQVWLEQLPDLSNELSGSPDHFSPEIATVVDVMGFAADLATVSVASAQLGAFLRNLLKRTSASSALRIAAKGKGGAFDLTLEAPDKKTAKAIARLLRDISK